MTDEELKQLVAENSMAIKELKEFEKAVSYWGWEI